MNRLHCALVGAIVLTAFTTNAPAATIYRETFGRLPAPPGSTANVLGNIFDWPMFRPADGNPNALIQTAASNAGTGGVSGNAANGKPIDVANINAGTNEDGTTGAQARGIFFMSNTIDGNNPGAPKFAWTPEYQFNPADYNNLTFSWYEGNSATTSQLQLAVRVGGQWYASATGFSTAAMGIGAFAANAELKTVVYNPAAANWLAFTFDGTYDVTTHTGTDSTVPIVIGAAPGSDLSGTITGFGLLGANGATEIRRFDTFQIDGNLVPEPTSATLALLVIAGLLGFRMRQK